MICLETGKVEDAAIHPSKTMIQMDDPSAEQQHHHLAFQKLM